MENLVRLLSQLPAPIGVFREQFVICGSGPMAVRYMRDVRDLDLLVSPGLWAQAPHLGFQPPPQDKDADYGDMEGEERVRSLHTEHGKIDLFLRTPCQNMEIADQIKRGVDLMEVPVMGYSGIAREPYQFQNLPDVLAIKLDVIRRKRPSMAKHLDDLQALASIIRVENRERATLEV